MKRYLYYWLIGFAIAFFISSCTYTGSITWSLCVHSNDTLEISYPIMDRLCNTQHNGNEVLNLNETEHRIVVYGDSYLQGTYFYSNKDRQYEHTERKFSIRRISKREPVKTLMLYHPTPVSSFGWIPQDTSQRDSVFDVMTQYYGEENLIQLPVNEEQISFSFQP